MFPLPPARCRRSFVPHRHRQQQIVPPLVQQRIVDHRAGCDNARNAALDQALGFTRIADLFSDRYRFAEADQLGQIAIQRMHRYARHRNRRACRLAALGQRDVEQARRAPRVVVEHLIEVAHAEQQQQIRLLGLERQVLAHQWGVVGNDAGGIRHEQTRGVPVAIDG